MLLSEMAPSVRKSRDKLARKIHARKGGDYFAALEEANGVIRAAIAKAQGRGAREARGVRETLTAAGLTPSMMGAPSAPAQPAPADDVFGRLPELDYDSATAAMEAGLATAYGATMRSPFWQGLQGL